MPDASNPNVAKPAVKGFRTFLQLSVVEAILRLFEEFGVKITPEQHIAILGAATPFVTWLQNKLEQQTDSGEYQVVGS